MTRFKVGDRVEVIDDIAHHHQSHVGIVTTAQQRPMAVVQEFEVRLADGTEHRFFDFQLHIPPAITAPIFFDSATSRQLPGTRGNGESRHLQFAVDDFDLHIKVTEHEGLKAILGQVTSRRAAPESPLVTLLVENEPQQTTAADRFGEFGLQHVQRGSVTLEVFVPGRRIIAAFDA